MLDTRWWAVRFSAATMFGLTWGGLVAAELGLPILLPAFGAVLLLCGALHLASAAPGRHPVNVRPTRASLLTDSATVVAVIVLGAVGFVPNETVLGGRDPGVYVNTAIVIARTHRIHFIDQTLAGLEPRVGHFLFGRTPEPWVRPGMPGFQIFDLARFEFQPHGFHAWPALLAVGYSVAGWTGVLFLPIVLRLWNLALAGLLARALGGPLLGLGTVLILGTNVAELWYGRTHAAEILVQTSLLSGLVFGLRALRFRSAPDGLLAGVALGLVHLTKIEFVLVPPFLFVVCVAMLARRWSVRSIMCFAVPYAALLSQAAAHAILVAPAYTTGSMLAMVGSLDPSALGRADPNRPFTGAFWVDLVSSNQAFVLPSLLLGVLLAALLGGLAYGVRRSMVRLDWVRPTPLLVAAVAALLSLLLFRNAALALPEQPSLLVSLSTLGEPQSLRNLALYFGIGGLVLALTGMPIAMLRAREDDARAVLAFFIVNLAPLLFAKWVADDHFWAGRRYVPLLVPAFALYSAGALIWGFGWAARRQTSTAGRIGVAMCCILVTGFLLFSNVRATAPFLVESANTGANARLLALARSLPDDGIIIMPWNSHATGLLVTPLVAQFEKPVFALQAERAVQPDFAEFARSLERENRHVYWFGEQQPAVDPGLEVEYLMDFDFAVSQPEAPTDRLPARFERLEFPLRLFRIQTGRRP